MKPFTVCIRDPCCVHTKMYIAPRSASIISGVESGQLAWPGECATVARQTDSSIHEWCLPHWEGAGGGRAGFLSDNILLYIIAHLYTMVFFNLNSNILILKKLIKF